MVKLVGRRDTDTVTIEPVSTNADSIVLVSDLAFAAEEVTECVARAGTAMSPGSSGAEISV